MDPVWILFGIFGIIVIWTVWSTFDTTVRKNECKCCGHRGHKAEQCFHRNQICAICHERGHLASVCTNIFEAENSQFKPSVVLWALTWIDYFCTSSDNRSSRCKSCGEWAHGTCQYAVRKCFRCRVKGHKSSACPGKKLYRKIVSVVWKTGAIVAAVVVFLYLQK